MALPQAVTKDDSGVYSVSYSSVVPLLVEAIKEQQHKAEVTNQESTRQIEQLKKQTRAFEATIATLERVIRRLEVRTTFRRSSSRRKRPNEVRRLTAGL